MFRYPESRLTSSLLAIPVLAVLLVGGAAIPPNHASRAPLTKPTVQIEEACVLDLTFSPVGDSVQAAATTTHLELNAAGVMDVSFSPASPEASPRVAAPAPQATVVEPVPAAGPDLGFNVAE